MEAVAPHALVPELSRQRQAPCNLRHGGMECGIETCHFRERWVVPQHRFHQLDLRRQVERRKRNEPLQRLQKRGSNFLWGSIKWAAMHNAMPRGLWPGEEEAIEDAEDRGQLLTRIRRDGLTARQDLPIGACQR